MNIITLSLTLCCPKIVIFINFKFISFWFVQINDKFKRLFTYKNYKSITKIFISAKRKIKKTKSHIPIRNIPT